MMRAASAGAMSATRTSVRNDSKALPRLVSGTCGPFAPTGGGIAALG